jgi:hypothetical protein
MFGAEPLSLLPKREVIHSLFMAVSGVAACNILLTEGGHSDYPTPLFSAGIVCGFHEIYRY